MRGTSDGQTARLDGETPLPVWSLGIDPQTGVAQGVGCAEQTEQALLNLDAILEAAGSSLDHLVKTTIFYANVEDFATINEVYGRHMPDPPPARSAPANVALPSEVSDFDRGDCDH